MLGFLISAAFGYAAPHLQKPLAEPVAKALEGKINISQTELPVLSFMIALLLAAIVCAALDAGSTFGLVIGAALGFFGTRIFEMVKDAIDGRRES